MNCGECDEFSEMSKSVSANVVSVFPPGAVALRQRELLFCGA